VLDSLERQSSELTTYPSTQTVESINLSHERTLPYACNREMNQNLASEFDAKHRKLRVDPLALTAEAWITAHFYS